MRRREFIALVGGAAAWPLAARAQQPQRPRRIAFLTSQAADDRVSRKRRYAAELVALAPDVIASRDRDLEPAFATFGKQGIGALQITTDGFFSSRREDLIELAGRRAIPTIYSNRDHTTEGGLLSYSSRQADAYHEAGVYAGRILRGAKPSDLPVMLPTKFELVINLKTAKALGLTIPEGLLLAADEVIE